MADPISTTTVATAKTQTKTPTHPLYQERLADWIQMEDTYAGERTVKEASFQYLAPTAGQRADGLSSGGDGLADYQAYKMRAVYHDVVKEAIQAMVGVMHRKPAVIEVPEKLKPMLERMTPDGENVQALLRHINEQQLLNARIGLLVDVPTGTTVADKAKNLPFIVTYIARSIINWDAGVSDQGERKIELVALDESAFERYDTFNWKMVEKTRILISDMTQLEGNPAVVAGTGYATALLRDGRTEPKPDDFTVPSIMGRTMPRVPFVFVNANDLVPEPEAPPLLGLSNIALALYRQDADYRLSLFLQAQETLVIIGATERDPKTRTGAGAIIDLPAGGDAKYVGVTAEGLDQMAKAIDAMLQTASDRGTKLLEFDAGGSSAASGEALKIRVAARTTTLTTVAQTGAEALKQALRMAAEWVGANPDEVKVEPNLDFADAQLTGQDMLNWVQAKRMGAPISNETLHRLMSSHDVTQMTYEEELDAIAEEEPIPGSTPVVPGTAVPLGPDGKPLAPDDPNNPNNPESPKNKAAAEAAALKTGPKGVPGGTKPPAKPGAKE